MIHCIVFNSLLCLTIFVTLHDKYIVVHVDKVSNNIVLFCAKNISMEFGISMKSGNPAHKNSSFGKSQVSLVINE